ncbi:MFS transporter [Halococcus saccharolyticus]|uniref:Major facilitator superfamily protein n=1 Tax=Halococcus saccharolyticus DSM 5350 TaxID=1227455 RepID=M0MC61_9EURY|nr:MFS transporter [Halococcus saccharolyticus]EMA43357.1 major facilitator superfamily protein [Halococcus saccharolyticus DSM 5350]
MASEPASVRDRVRELFALERDVLVLSVAMFAFSLGFQMTSRYLGEYMVALGASAFVVGLYGTFSNVISAVYPYPGGAISDRIGSRYALTVFGLLSVVGFVVWLVAPVFGALAVPLIFVGLVFAQAWKSFGLGATFAIVKQSVPPARLAEGFASTETFRRTAFLVGPLLAAGVFATFATTDAGSMTDPQVVDAFVYVLAIAVVFAILGTLAQHVLYDSAGDDFGKKFEGVSQVANDLRNLPPELRPLLIGDTLVRFANGMVYVFFVIVVTRFLDVGLSTTVPVVGTIDLSPQAYFGILLGIEMAVALLTMIPIAKLTRRVGLKPVVGLGFAVYAIFPTLLIVAPPDAGVLAALFAFSGLRFAGLPAHKALIVGPAERGAGGRVTGSYYLVRNVAVIPSAALGGVLYGGLALPGVGQVLAGSPPLAFGAATVVGLLGTGYFLVFGEEFAAINE